MIQFKTGDILKEDAEALVNTVNCVGFMGRGIALQFKNVFPSNFKSYNLACKLQKVQPGKMFVFETGQLTNPRFIINFPTKRHWRGKSRIEDIDAGLISLVKEIRLRKISSIAIPPLGSGLGGLDWSKVRPRIEAALQELSELKVVIFEPIALSKNLQANYSTDVPKMTSAHAALVGLINRYLRGLLDPFVTLLEVHKLMYFMQYAGEPLKLKFEKANFGPYAENLRHVLNRVEGHLVSGYADGGDRPDKRLELVPGALEDANAFLKSQVESQSRLERVTDLVEGFESPFGLELLSTVHWIVTNESVQSLEDVVRQTYAWNKQKEQFSKRQIALTVDVLTNKQWISPLSISTEA